MTLKTELIIEVIVLCVGVLLAIAWYISAQSPYEPLLSLVLIVPLGVHVYKKYLCIKTVKSPKNSKNKKSHELTHKQDYGRDEAKVLKNRVMSASFFSERFSFSFPGITETTWYSPKDAVIRLSALFKEPFYYKGTDGTQTPIWWFGNGNMGIDSFSVLDDITVLLDSKEIQIKRLAAIPSSTYYCQFIYVESEPMPPTGLYSRTESEIDSTIEQLGYVCDEYGIFRGQYFVTRKQYDDNAMVIDGQPVSLQEGVELRIRYLSPYNFVIAPQTSPINNGKFDTELVGLLKTLIEDHSKISELQESVSRLPRHPMLYDN
jgi:hypothetical protein